MRVNSEELCKMIDGQKGSKWNLHLDHGFSDDEEAEEEEKVLTP